LQVGADGDEVGVGDGGDDSVTNICSFIRFLVRQVFHSTCFVKDELTKGKIKVVAKSGTEKIKKLGEKYFRTWRTKKAF
jgi:hypothetical protein